MFLCLPDAASRESVALLAPGNTRTRFIDASTAHRTDPQWVYGLPELNPGQRERICQARLPRERLRDADAPAGRRRHRTGRLSGHHLVGDRLQRRRQGDDRELRRTCAAARQHEEPALLCARPHPQASAGDADHLGPRPRAAVHAHRRQLRAGYGRGGAAAAARAAEGGHAGRHAALLRRVLTRARPSSR
ncbi:MAG TPA: hypothetical protein PL143_03655 [Rhodocyclaceae bacterium]|nr:hypothetical protein [Rhodocyclaceae bacterium]